MTSRRLLVLYGTTRGSSKKAAEDFLNQCATELSSAKLQELTNVSNVEVKCEGPIALDVFLKDPTWAPLVVIFVSSFGSGDGPMKGRKFRKRCNAWIQAFQEVPDKPKPLQSLSFALCGLGDSSYETYMQNPTVTCQALELLGAQRVGEQGSADAAKGEAAQTQEIENWMKDTWPQLAKALVQEPMTEEQLDAAREFVLKEEEA